ncbi:MAG: hypothetical protein QM731_17270 [Chitinophagaceae bacterium]
MKKFVMGFLFASVLVSVGSTAQAQLDALKKTATSTAQTGIGNLLTQFSSAIKPTSFLSSWTGQKTSWLGAASKVTDAVGTAKSISSLAGFIKPDMFKSGFNVNSLIQTAGTVKTMSSATGLLKNLEGGLKPEALTSAWSSQRSGWLSALDLVK